MVSIVLPGPWRGAATSDELRRAFIEADFDDSAWAPMTVPGHWAEHDRLASRRSVLYRTRFDAPADIEPDGRHWLVFDGIWRAADVWLDGNYLGPTEGWFTRHEFEVTEAMATAGHHLLAVEVMAPAEPIDGPTNALLGIYGDHDIVGHQVRGGIWRPVRLVSTGPVRMTKNRVICKTASSDRAIVHLRSHVLSEEARTATIVTTVRPPGGGPPITTRRDYELAGGATVLEWDVEITDPELWWPWELGDQPLYRVTVSVEIGGRISTIWERTVGLRSVTMRNWVLSINGERLFARGAHLWPTTSLPAQADPDTIAADISRARDLGLNLLRVESHVARPELYEAADRVGVLLWQDLPMRGEVKRSVRPAAVEGAHRMVDDLGGHPSIALWCAHYDPTGTSTGPHSANLIPSRRNLFSVAKQQAPTMTKSILDRLVGRAFSRADPSRPVVQGSGNWPSAPFFDGTDTHVRFGWHNGIGRDLEGFARRIPRMVRWVTSFGTQSIPESPEVAVRNWPPDLNLLRERYGLSEGGFRRYLAPGDHDSAAAWREASQAYQATLLRRQIETLRRLKYRPTGGFTFSALADCRPSISFGIFDHRRQPKQAVGAVAAACRPTIVVADRLPARIGPGDAVLVDVHVVSDERVPLRNMEVVADLVWPGGSHRWAWRGDVDADSVARVGSINWVAPDTVGPVTLDLQLTDDGDEIADNHYQSEIEAPPDGAAT